MPIWMLAMVAILNLGAAIGLLADGRVGLALFCLGCVIANAGLIYDIIRPAN